MPTSRWATCRLIVAPADHEHVAERDRRRTSPAPGTRARNGARKCSKRSAPRRHDVFLGEELERIGDQRVDEAELDRRTPKMAARLAPMRSWMSALPLRSTQHAAAPTTCRTMRITARALTATIANRSIAHRAYAGVDVRRSTLCPRQAVDELERLLDGEVLRDSRRAELDHGAVPHEPRHSTSLERELAVGGRLAGVDPERARRNADESRRRRAARTRGSCRPGGGAGPSAACSTSCRRRPTDFDPGERQLHQLGDVGHARRC